MTNEELIKNIETQIEFEEKSKSEYNLGIKDAYKNILVLFKQLEVPETTEEPTFLKHLTDLFKKHGYDHLGQVALALEHDLELSINKELPVIPQFVADEIERTKEDDLSLYDLLYRIETWVIEGYEVSEHLNLITRAWLDGYTVEKEPAKTRQVIVKFFDNKEYRTDLTEDAARELIEFLEAKR